MNTLKQLTRENHRKAERTEYARKLLRGLPPAAYHRYLYNQYSQYSALEAVAEDRGVLEGIEDIPRAPEILKDLEELEAAHDLRRSDELLCPVVAGYAEHVSRLDPDGILAHIYVRHFGDMYGGQMIKRKNPGSGHMYRFSDAEALKARVRSRLHDAMAPEANRCFEFAIALFSQLQGSRLDHRANTASRGPSRDGSAPTGLDSAGQTHDLLLS
jgi:heme oxygenase